MSEWQSIATAPRDGRMALQPRNVWPRADALDATSRPSGRIMTINTETRALPALATIPLANGSRVLADPHGDYIHGPAFSPNVRIVPEPEQSILVEFARQRFGRPMTCACGCGRTAYLMPMPPADLDGVA